MKKSILIFMIILGLCVSFIMPDRTAGKACAAGAGTITVSGYGSVTVKPDTAYLNIGVRTAANEAAVAYAENTAKINAVIAALEGAGIAGENIKNIEHSLFPEYSYVHPERKITGYTATNVLKVKVKDLKLLPDVYAKASEAGANMDSGLQFAAEDNSDAASAAFGRAVENAGDKAAAIAGKLGIILGAPVEITESLSYGGNVYHSLARAETGDLKSYALETIRAGEISVEARLTVKYAY